MGYQITITRGDENSEDGLISVEEWLRFVETDNELYVVDTNEPFPVVKWLRGNMSADFFWEEAGIWSWSPENLTVSKMIEIAGKLGANVVGEDGTRFTDASDGNFVETYPE